MKKAREEIGVSIQNNKLILFEAVPLNFGMQKELDHRDENRESDEKDNRC